MSPMDQLTMKLAHHFVFILCAFCHTCAEGSHLKSTSKNTKQRDYNTDIQPYLIRVVGLCATSDKFKLGTLNIFPVCSVVEKNR